MATLSVWKFDTAEGAQQILEKVQGLQKQQLITVQDAAIVTWPQGKSKPQTKQLNNLAGVGAMQGAFWGMLFGLLFFVPFFGLAIGAAMGALSGKFADYGIDDKFIKEVQTKVTEGTSALFLLTSDAVHRQGDRGLQGHEHGTDSVQSEHRAGSPIECSLRQRVIGRCRLFHLGSATRYDALHSPRYSSSIAAASPQDVTRRHLSSTCSRKPQGVASIPQRDTDARRKAGVTRSKLTRYSCPVGTESRPS